jgi:hypothetical protein
MRLITLAYGIIVLLLIVPLGIFSVAADNEQAESIVDARFTIEMASATDLTITVSMDVQEIMVFDTMYTSSDISSLTDMETMGAIKLMLRNLVKEQLRGSFNKSKVTALRDKPLYEYSVFTDKFSVNLTSAFFDMNTSINAHDVVNGLLDVGAQLLYTFTFQAVLGWDNIYALSLPSSLSRPYTNGDVDGNRILWQVENEKGFHPVTVGELEVYRGDPTTPRLEQEDVSLMFTFDSRTSPSTAMTFSINAHAIDIRPYDILPDFVTKLSIIPADAVRLFIDNNLVTWDEIYNTTIRPVCNETLTSLEQSSFNQTFDLLFNWDTGTTVDCSVPFDIMHMDAVPPVRAVYTDDDVALDIYGISSRAVFGLVNAGAQTNISAKDVNFGDTLRSLSYASNITLILPDGVFIDGKQIYTYDKDASYLGDVISTIAPDYATEHITTYYDIDIRSTDLNLLSFLTGSTELSLGFFIREVQNYSVSTLPDEFSLPENILLSYLNADAFRLCIDENVFTEQQITLFLNREKTVFENRVKTMMKNLEAKGNADLNVFESSLSWDKDITKMDAEKPVQVSSYTYCSHPALFSLSFLPPKFQIYDQQFTFSGIPHEKVTYRMTMPRGTTVQVTDTLGKAEMNMTNTGRYYVEVTFYPLEADQTDIVTITLIPSALYVVSIFIPCLLSLVITIILVVVIYVIRKKRKRTRGVAVPQQPQEVTGLEAEEYYVPPPPPSSRR